MDKGGLDLEIKGLQDLVKGLRGKEFRDVNSALRDHARMIADTAVPAVKRAVAQSNAPQAPAMVSTVTSVRDRIPVISIGKTNPRFSSSFTRRGNTRKNGKPRTGEYTSKRRRGAIAHGVVYGPKGGHRHGGEANFYGIPRDDTGGPVGAAMKEHGLIWRYVVDAYLAAYLDVLTDAGFMTTKGGFTGLD